MSQIFGTAPEEYQVLLRHLPGDAPYRRKSWSDSNAEVQASAQRVQWLPIGNVGIRGRHGQF
jgi:hypothetical protein